MWEGVLGCRALRNRSLTLEFAVAGGDVRDFERAGPCDEHGSFGVSLWLYCSAMISFEDEGGELGVSQTLRRCVQAA